jgi:hypothetical protein
MATRRKRKAPSYNESDKLLLFLYRMSQLESRTYIKELRPRLPDDLEFQEPNVELFDAFMLTFRHFYASNEPTCLDSIHAVLVRGAKVSANEDMVKALVEIREAFSKSPRYRIDVYDKDPSIIHTRLTNDELFDLYINCLYFHTDVRGGGFFFQLPEADRARCHKVFQLSLVKYIKRLRAYVPLAASTLNARIFPHGYFRTGDGIKSTFHFVVPSVNRPL